MSPPPCFQVVFTEPLRKSLERWLDSRGLYLFEIPLPDDVEDLPTFGIGIKGDQRLPMTGER